MVAAFGSWDRISFYPRPFDTQVSFRITAFFHERTALWRKLNLDVTEHWANKVPVRLHWIEFSIYAVHATRACWRCIVRSDSIHRSMQNIAPRTFRKKCWVLPPLFPIFEGSMLCSHFRNHLLFHMKSYLKNCHVWTTPQPRLHVLILWAASLTMRSIMLISQSRPWSEKSAFENRISQRYKLRRPLVTSDLFIRETIGRPKSGHRYFMFVASWTKHQQWSDTSL